MNSSAQSTRPPWVTILGFLSILVGILLTVIMFSVGILGLSASNYSLLLGIVIILIMFLIPILFFVAAYGFFKMKKWTSKLLMGIFIFFLVIGISISLVYMRSLGPDSLLIAGPFFIYPLILVLIWWAVYRSKNIFTN